MFAPKASVEDSAVTHTATGPDGQKKELPLYFGPDWPVSSGTEQSRHGADTGDSGPRMSPCIMSQLMMRQGVNLIPQTMWIWRKNSPGVP